MNPESTIEPLDNAPPNGALSRKLHPSGSAGTQRVSGGGGGGLFGGAGRTRPVSVDKVRRQDVHVSVSALGTNTTSDIGIGQYHQCA